jgi:hypothetical protein
MFGLVYDSNVACEYVEQKRISFISIMVSACSRKLVFYIPIFAPLLIGYVLYISFLLYSLVCPFLEPTFTFSFSILVNVI